jgi:hypothetical protein
LFILKGKFVLLVNTFHQIQIARVGKELLDPLHTHQIVIIGAPIKGVSWSGTRVLESNLQPILNQVNTFTLLVPPTIIDANGMGVDPDRNEEQFKHVKRFQALTKKLELIQVSHLLRLNVLVFVAELSICILGKEMLCRAKEIRESIGGGRVMPTIIAQSLGPTFIFRAKNLPR